MTIDLALLITHSLLAIASLFFGTLIYIHGRESATNRFFAFVSIGVAMFAVANFIAYQESSELAVLGLRLAFVSVCIQTLFITLFMYNFPNPEFKIKATWKKYALWAGGLLYIIIGFATIKGPEFNTSFVYQGRTFFLAQLNAFTYLWTPTSFILSFTPAIIAFRKYRRAEGEMRRHLKIIFFTIVLAFLILPFVLVIPAQVFHNIIPNIWAPLVYLPLIIAVAYATLRRHLFNVKAIVAEILIFTIWIFLLARIFLNDNNQDRFLDGTLFIFTVFVGIFLMRSVFSEVQQKEKLSELNAQLDDLNQNLQQKVVEQTIEIRKSYEVEKKARIELEELDKAKDQFILTTQHHLRTPLTIVKGYLQSILSGKTEPISETAKIDLEKAEEATERMGTLVNEFLDISQMEVGKSILSKQPTHIKVLLENIIKEFEPAIQDRKLSINIEVQDDSVLNIDVRRIKESLKNIIDNAIRYNKSGGNISIRGSAVNRSSIERDRRIYRITIEDSGIGLTRDELSKLFVQYFQRGEEALKLYPNGRGMGLSVTRNIIAGHGGKIFAESEGRNKGSKFTIELPLMSS